MSTFPFSTLTTAPITYPLTTWMGTLTSWSEPTSCSSITEAITITLGPSSRVPSSSAMWPSSSLRTSNHWEYRNNITHWETLTRHCRPGALAIQTGEYFYPAFCPVGWTSYPTISTVIVTVTTTDTTTLTSTSSAEFTDAMCCPPGYRGYLLGNSHFCSVTYYRDAPDPFSRGSRQNYYIRTWSLTAMVNSAGVITSKESASSSAWIPWTLKSDVVMTAWPVFVRYPNTEASFAPTKTGEGWLGNTAINHKPADRAAQEAEEDRAREKKGRKDLITWVCVPIGIIIGLFIVVWVVWKVRHSGTAYEQKKQGRMEKRRRKYEESRRKREGGGVGKDEEEGEGMQKPELMGSVYVGPQVGRQKDGEGKPELDGHVTEISDARGVVKSLEELKYDEIKIDNDNHDMTHMELDNQSGRRGTAETELDHQSRRRGVADAELDGVERQRRAAEMDAGRMHQQRIARKQVPDRATSFGSEISPASSRDPAAYPHSPVLSGPMPDFTAMYGAPVVPEAVEEERKLERQAQRLQERREQLAREEEALRAKLAQRGSGV